MRKEVSPLFALIVIVIAIALGAIWFLVRERAYQAEWQRQAEAAKRTREAAIRSGRGRFGPRGAMPGRSGRPGVGEEGAAAGPTGRSTSEQPGATSETPAETP